MPGQELPMPGPVKTSRVLLYVIGGLNVLGGVLLLLAGAAQSGELLEADGEGLSAAGLYLGGLLSLALAGVAIVLAARFRSGRQGVRIGAAVVGGLVAANGLLSAVTGSGGLSVAGIALGGITLVNCLKGEAAGYFGRPRTVR
ncbi:hypothetical protein ABT160_27090 [Streptomyces sp. NPDC001941]|uniref:hypothetical protein n=1 Tax=Streptomyces sp. NPDC001941 TaxID=3154659 RepID=UPI00332EA0FD